MIPSATLPGTNRTTTAIGFGGNALLGSRSRREGLALLAEAYDSGVRHFDVARAYSSGDAEGLLGEFLAGRRDGVTITTKFGLQPPSAGIARMRWVKSLARRLMRLSPKLRKAIGAKSGQMVQRGAFSIDQARASLEVSLRELGTDRVEILLLHEAGPDDCSLELRDFLEEMVRDGRIGAYGVGSQFGLVQAISHQKPDFARIFQFENSVTRRNREILAPSPTIFTITHGAIGGSFGHLRTFLAERPDTAKRWSNDLGLDLANASILALLMLSYALHANPGGIVLFSSTRPETIRANIVAIAEGRFPPDQLDRFGVLAKEVADPTGENV